MLYSASKEAGFTFVFMCSSEHVRMLKYELIIVRYANVWTDASRRHGMDGISYETRVSNVENHSAVVL